jgi:L-2-hydroxyglutarate oxidase
LKRKRKLARTKADEIRALSTRGIYYKPGSLKAKNCIRGRELLINFAREHRLQHNICGKIIVATKEGQLQQLKNIYSCGLENGLSAIETY